MKKFFLAIAIIILLFFFGRGFAATVSVYSNSNWSSLSIGSGDNVTVRSGAVLTIDVSNAVCNSVTLGVDKGGSGTLKFNSGSVISLTYTANSLTLGSGNATGSLDMSLGGTLNLAGTINSSNVGTFNVSSGIINYTRSGNQIVYAATYNNLILSGSGTKTLSSGITVNGTLSIEGNSTIAGSSPTFGSSSVLQYKGSSAQTISSIEFPAANGPNNLTINNSAGVSFSSRTIPGTLTLTNGALNITGDTLTLNGTISTGSGYLAGDSTSSVIVIGGTGANTTLPLVQNGLKNLTINRANGVTLGADLTVNGLLTMTSGLLTTSTYKIYFTTAATKPTESTSSYIVGTAIMKQRNVGTGTIDFLNSYIQGSSNIGYVTITRKTGTDGIITVNGNSGIAANWDFATTVAMAGTRGVTFRWPSALDNGIVFSPTILAQLYYNNAGSLELVGSGVNVSGTSLRSMTVTLSHFSQYTIGSSNSPLPVSLSSFTSNVNGRNVRLNWSTQKEINNKGFEIQRAEIGNQSQDYGTIGFVNGRGNTASATNYSFEDSKLSAGKYKYRLKQIDYNGNYEYFELNNSVEVSLPGRFSLSQNYPNPFNPSTKIDFEIPAESKVSISVFDASGKEVGTLLNENKKAGYYTVTFNASGLSSGMYFCRMTAKSSDNNYALTNKMVLVK